MKKFILLFWLILGALSLSSCTEEEEITQGDIVGVVTDAVNGTQPLSGVQVSILPNGASTSTGSDGKFSFPQLKAGEYKIQFMKEGYETNTKSVTVVPGQVSNADIQLTAVMQDALIQITPSTLNFGTTQNELSVKIQNNGNTSTDWYNPQIQISAESETKRSIFRKRDKTKRSKKESAQHSKSRNKSFVMTSVSAL